MNNDQNNNSEIQPLRQGEINSRRIRIDSLSPQRNVNVLLKRPKNSKCTKCKRNSGLKVGFALLLTISCILFLVLGIIMITNLISNLQIEKTKHESKSLMQMECNESMQLCEICNKTVESCQIRELNSHLDFTNQIFFAALDQVCDQCFVYNTECSFEVTSWSDTKSNRINPSAKFHFHFCYNEEHCDPETWIGECETGRSQSPITLPHPNTITRKFGNSSNTDGSHEAILGFNDDYKRNYYKFYIENNGHTVQIKLQEDFKSNCTIFGKTLDQTPYELAQLHLHWGSEAGVGSEHGISEEFTELSTHYELEIHFVHYSTKYDSLHQAVVSSDSKALAVLGVFVKLNESMDAGDNVNLNVILNAINSTNLHETLEYNVREKEGEIFNLYSIFPKVKNFYRYGGSLTTPPCSEKVNWIIFHSPIPISQKQFQILQNIKNHHNHQPLSNNYRPVQPTNNREIIFHDMSE